MPDVRTETEADQCELELSGVSLEDEDALTGVANGVLRGTLSVLAGVCTPIGAPLGVLWPSKRRLLLLLLLLTPVLADATLLLGDESPAALRVPRLEPRLDLYRADKARCVRDWAASADTSCPARWASTTELGSINGGRAPEGSFTCPEHSHMYIYTTT